MINTQKLVDSGLYHEYLRMAMGSILERAVYRLHIDGAVALNPSASNGSDIH